MHLAAAAKSWTIVLLILLFGRYSRCKWTIKVQCSLENQYIQTELTSRGIRWTFGSLFVCVGLQPILNFPCYRSANYNHLLSPAVVKNLSSKLHLHLELLFLHFHMGIIWTFCIKHNLLFQKDNIWYPVSLFCSAEGPFQVQIPDISISVNEVDVLEQRENWIIP